MRAISRVEGVSFNTVDKLFVAAGETAEDAHNLFIRNIHARRVECDEMWSFCYAKSKRAALTGKQDAGDAWVWLGVDPDTKLLIAYHIGSRDTADAMEFIYGLASRVTGRVSLSTDGYAPYVDAVRAAFGNDIDFAQLVKQYGPRPWAPNQNRYTGTQKIPVIGSPNLQESTTAHVERQNLTMRMGNRRFTRQTNGFSKLLRNHELSVALHAWHYNFARGHMSLNQHGLDVTPAMKAGLAEEPLSFLWLLENIDRRWSARAARPGPKPLPPVNRATHSWSGLRSQQGLRNSTLREKGAGELLPARPIQSR